MDKNDITNEALWDRLLGRAENATQQFKSELKEARRRFYELSSEAAQEALLEGSALHDQMKQTMKDVSGLGRSIVRINDTIEAMAASMKKTEDSHERTIDQLGRINRCVADLEVAAARGGMKHAGHRRAQRKLRKRVKRIRKVVSVLANQMDDALDHQHDEHGGVCWPDPEPIVCEGGQYGPTAACCSERCDEPYAPSDDDAEQRIERAVHIASVYLDEDGASADAGRYAVTDIVNALRPPKGAPRTLAATKGEETHDEPERSARPH